MHGATIDIPPQRYCLNMQVLVDELEARQVDCTFHCRSEAPVLRGVRFYSPKQKPSQEYVYLLSEQDSHLDFQNFEQTHFIVVGEVYLDAFSFTSSVIGLPAGTDLPQVYNMLQEIFEKYAAWDEHLHWALQRENPLEEMLSASRSIFENPVFVHDMNFYILACSGWVKGMPVWEKDARTGQEMVPIDLINEFKIDEEYLSSLKAKEVSMFSSSIRGYRILFANLWHQEHYDGRVCVDELERPLRKSDYLHLSHLASLIMLCLTWKKLFWMSLGDDIDRYFIKILTGESFDARRVQEYLGYVQWKERDKYVVLKIVPGQDDRAAMTPMGLFGYIEAQIPEGRALLVRNDIVVVVNLTAGKTTMSEVLSNLAYILREGLFKMGVSAELGSVLDIRDGYTQAAIALTYGKKSNSMLWYYHFEDYALSFLLDSAREKISPHLLASEKLRKLREYDGKNGTELYHTMEVYLRLERNVVQTAKTLFVHRSTLFYRLERIQKVIGVDFDNEEERLYLTISYRLDHLER